MRTLILALSLGGCFAATGPQPSPLVNVAIADALIEARDIPDMPSDFPAPAPQEVEQPKPAQAVQTIDAEYLPRLVIYTAPDWCVPCKTLDKEIRRVESFRFDGKLRWKGMVGPGPTNAIQVIDASCSPSPEMTAAIAARITAWPTLIRIGNDGQEESRYTGTLTAEQLTQYQSGKVIPAKAIRKQAVQASGLHTHKCPSCSTQWHHDGKDVIDHVKDHTCPKCGTVQYEIDHFGPVTAGAK